MTTTMQQRILRANAVWLIAAGCGSLVVDVLGIFFAQGPQRVIASVPHTGVGFVEAHGLALIFGVLLWRAAPTREWHLAAAAVHTLLGAANLVFWQFFVTMDMLAAGYLTTALHWLFVGLQLFAATAAFKANDSHAGLAASS